VPRLRRGPHRAGRRRPGAVGPRFKVALRGLRRHLRGCFRGPARDVGRAADAGGNVDVRVNMYVCQRHIKVRFGHQGEATRILTEWENAMTGAGALPGPQAHQVPGVPSNLAIVMRVGLRAYPLPSRR